MKNTVLLITALLGFKALAVTTNYNNDQEKEMNNLIKKVDKVETQVALKTDLSTHYLLMKPEVNNSNLFQIVSSSSWQACRDDCHYDFTLCLQNGFDRASCRVWYLDCLSENCSQ